MQLGAFRVDQVVDGAGRFKPTRTFVGSTDEQWEVHKNLLDADGLLPFTAKLRPAADGREWAALFDVDPELAKRTRNALAAELVGTDVRVSGAHFPEMTFGRLVRAEGKRRFVV